MSSKVGALVIGGVLILGAFFIGLAAYLVLYGVAMARGGAWAARVEPPADSSAI